MRVFLSLLTGLMLLCAPLSARGETYLRVIARDDTPRAQAEKLRIRDAALSVCAGQNALTLEQFLQISFITRAVAPCSVSLRAWQPAPALPSAPCVYIVIGEGEGKNWWGVLYEDSVRFFGDEDGQEEITFRWAILDFLRALFGL